MVEEKNAILMKIEAEAEIIRHIVEKGSVALDGISLTVAQVTDSDFTVSLIPHTRKVTNLGSKSAGSRINIENDVLGKYVEKLLQPRDEAQSRPAASKLTMEFLQQHGF